MADGYLSMLQLAGTALMVAIRAALIPSSPRRTILVTESLVQLCIQHVHHVPQPLSGRGVTVPRELEAVVLQCLDKDPNKRPQSAAELRRRIEACPVAAWSEQNAQDWWLEHQSAIDRDVAPALGQQRTVNIDGSPRSAVELAASPA